MHGSGHYIDKLTMERTHMYAGGRAWKPPAVVPQQLRIAKLNLAGFVVDADPFMTYFDPEYLREINFGDHCIDAGFALTKAMLEDVKITRPEQKSLSEDIAQALSSVTLQGGGLHASTYATILGRAAVPITATQQLGHGDGDRTGPLTGEEQHHNQMVDKGHIEAGAIDEEETAEQSGYVAREVDQLESEDSTVGG